MSRTVDKGGESRLCRSVPRTDVGRASSVGLRLDVQQNLPDNVRTDVKRDDTVEKEAREKVMQRQSKP